MTNIHADHHRLVEDISARHGFSTQAVQVLLAALTSGSRSMAQFDHPELGGMGQWSRGGMVMIGRMGDQALKARVAAACGELAAALALEGGAKASVDLLQDGGSIEERAVGYSHGGSGASVAMPEATAQSWWPSELGQPAATGTQNHVRYANFADRHRLAIEIGGRVTVYDTGQHRIAGFSQRQDGSASLVFRSQHGPVSITDLAIVSPVQVAAPASEEYVFKPTPRQGGNDQPPKRTGQYVDPPTMDCANMPKRREESVSRDALSTIERLADLQRKGSITEAEFRQKKAELLARV